MAAAVSFCNLKKVPTFQSGCKCFDDERPCLFCHNSFGMKDGDNSPH